MDDVSEQTALLDGLTAKQHEVVRHVSEGLTSKEIARKLGISESAVNQRIETIRMRLGGISRTQLGRLYRQTSTLVITIPTSNSLTGKSIQLQTEDKDGQQLSAEGVVNFAVPGTDEVRDGLQPSNLSPPVWGGTASVLFRLGVIVWIAVGVSALAVLILTASHSISELLPKIH